MFIALKSEQMRSTELNTNNYNIYKTMNNWNIGGCASFDTRIPKMKSGGLTNYPGGQQQLNESYSNGKYSNVLLYVKREKRFPVRTSKMKTSKAKASNQFECQNVKITRIPNTTKYQKLKYSEVETQNIENRSKYRNSYSEYFFLHTE